MNEDRGSALPPPVDDPASLARGPSSTVLALTLLLSAATTNATGGPARTPPSFDDCDTEVREKSSTPDYGCYLDLTRRGADWREAERRLQAIVTRDPADLDALFTLANVLGEQGELRAEELYRRVADRFAATDRSDREVLARRNLASLLNTHGRLDESQAELELSATLAEASGDRTLVAVVRNQQAGQLVLANRDLGRAYRMLKEVEEAVFPDGSEQTQSGCLYYLAIATFEMGRFDEAAVYFERKALFDRERGNPAAEANAHLGLLRVHEERLMREQRWSRSEIEPVVRRGLEVALRSGSRYAEATFRDRLAKLVGGDEGRRHAERALELARQAGWADGISGSLLRLAELEVRSPAPDPAAAFSRIDEALERSRRRGNLWKAAQALVVRADLRWETGPRRQAIADSLAALDAVEAVRDLQSDEDARSRVFSMSIVHYYSLVGRLLSGDGAPPSREDLELAFTLSERRRARGLLETFDAAHATSALSPDGDLWHERQRVLGDIAQLQRRLLDETLADADRLASLAELERLEREEAELRVALARENRRFGDLRAPRFAALTETEAALAEDTALLVYQLGTTSRSDGGYGGGSWVLVVTRRGTTVHRLPDARALEPAIELFLGLLESRESREERAAARLYTWLLAPALDGLGSEVHRLVLVLDGVMHRLPLSILRGSPDAAPVLVRYEISVAPSATTWLRLRMRPPGPPRAPVLVLADPERTAHADDDAASRRGASLWSAAAQLGRLPAARAEGRAAVRRLAGGSRLLTGRSASEAVVKAETVRSYAMLHFATHALIDEQRPERSAILLAPGAPHEDGLLQLREIVGLDLDGQVVLLSACRSASGELVLGEGVLGLARAFFQAGARSVLASLWTLRDEDGRRLMEELYDELARGETLATSLATAQRRRRLSGAPPPAWAGMVLLGDGDLRLAPSAPRSRPWIVGTLAALVLLMLLLVAWLLRRCRPTSAPD